jgi:hypothetical protein
MTKKKLITKIARKIRECVKKYYNEKIPFVVSIEYAKGILEYYETEWWPESKLVKYLDYLKYFIEDCWYDEDDYEYFSFTPMCKEIIDKYIYLNKYENSEVNQ